MCFLAENNVYGEQDLENAVEESVLHVLNVASFRGNGAPTDEVLPADELYCIIFIYLLIYYILVIRNALPADD